MTFRITYSACQSPLGCQPILNVLKWNPVAHIFSGDYVYNDSNAVYTHNGQTLNPTIWWDFAVAPTGAPANAHTAQYTLDRFRYHYGREGMVDYQKFWAEYDAGKFLVFSQADDHDHKCNNYDHAIATAAAGFPMPAHGTYGQIHTISTKAHVLALWEIGQAGRRLFDAQYTNNPPYRVGSTDIPSELVGTAAANKFDEVYHYQDFDKYGNRVDGSTGTAVHRVIFIDCVTYKSPALATDNASKQMLGATQEAWVLASCASAVAAGIRSITVSSSKDLFNVDNNDGWWTYSTRRDILLKAMHDANYPVVWMCGDRHVPHAAKALVSAGDTYDMLSLCACPFGQGTGQLQEYKQNFWQASYNDQCVYGLIEVDEISETTVYSIIDAWTNDRRLSMTVPWGSRLPSETYVAPRAPFRPCGTFDRTAPAVPASNANYQNTSNQTIILNIIGGTVSNIAVSRDGTTFDSLGLQRQVILGPGDYMKPTYTVAPTLSVFPINSPQ